MIIAKTVEGERVHALRLTEENLVFAERWSGGTLVRSFIGLEPLLIVKRKGLQAAKIGDYIIKFENGRVDWLNSEEFKLASDNKFSRRKKS